LFRFAAGRSPKSTIFNFISTQTTCLSVLVADEFSIAFLLKQRVYQFLLLKSFSCHFYSNNASIAAFLNLPAGSCW
jgi:hypothetical protein